MQQSNLSPLKRAYMAIEKAEARVAALEQAGNEPIAIIGFGCRVPGADNPAALWGLMRDGVDAISKVPSDRFDIDSIYDSDPAIPGRIATRYGGFIHDVDQFDCGFFGISPREAQGMDPQQRLLLEVSWEALEHAGQAPDRLERSPTGVYMAVCSSDYAYLQIKSGDAALLDAHFTSGIAHSIFTGRISYVLGLQGPSVTIDTACSSSLVATHLACNALRNGECRMALAGGVNLILAPDLFIALSRARMLAPDGRCKTFDAAADGFSRGEGCGVVVLKRLSDAQADGDRILALIRGSAVNQDGPSGSITAPNGPAQESVIREALRRAGVGPADVGFVEAHGTGTQLGDPLEINALGAVFAERDRSKPLIIGSVKTNIGHLEAAAGVVGLIKVVLALQHRTIPPALHFNTPNRHIAWGDLPLKVSVKSLDWEPIGGRRIGGVSSFGFSGTNAHVILEEAPACVAEQEPLSPPAFILALSAKDRPALTDLAQRLADAVAGRPDRELADICYSANSGRAHFAHRAAIVCRTIGELRTGLAAVGHGEQRSGVFTGDARQADPPRVAFLFTGQGAQYVGMSQGLYDAFPVFRAALDRCAKLLQQYLETPLLDLIFPGPDTAPRLDETGNTQPALFAVEYALSELWRSWGVTPNAVMGHSLGEYVAACVAGILPLEEALRLVARRGQLMQSLSTGGAMAAIHAPERLVAEAVATRRAYLSIAAVNSPDQTVVSGRADQVDIICREFVANGIRCHLLPVSHAFHSPLIDPILDQFETEASKIRFSAPKIRLISNLTGRIAEAGEVTRPLYWRRHLREAVRFNDGLRTLGELHPDIMIEIGPTPTLLGFAASADDADAALRIASLRKGRPDLEQILESLAAIYVAGAQIEWRGMAAGASRRIVDLPTYPFQRQRHWFHARTDLIRPNQALSDPHDHPLLGHRLRSAIAETVYENKLTAAAPRFIEHHKILSRVVLPAAAYLEMLLASGHRQLRMEAVTIENVIIGEALVFEGEPASILVQTVCAPATEGSIPVSINSVVADADSDDWVQNVTANIRVEERKLGNAVLLEELRKSCPEPVNCEELYASFARRGVDFGSSFHVIRQLWCGQSQALGEIALAAEAVLEASNYRMHPLLLDGCLQMIAAALGSQEEDALYLPFSVDQFTLHRQFGARCWSHVTVRLAASESCCVDILLFDPDGQQVGELRSVNFKRVKREDLERHSQRWLDDCLYDTRWRLAPLKGATLSGAKPQQAPGVWLIFADQGGVAEGLAARLKANGRRCILVRPGRFVSGSKQLSIDPTSAADYRRIFDALDSEGQIACGVIHAWSLDVVSWDPYVE